MERAEGADEGPERSQVRTKQRNQAKGAMMIGLSTTRTSIYGGHMMWLCNGWRRAAEARYSRRPRINDRGASANTGTSINDHGASANANASFTAGIDDADNANASTAGIFYFILFYFGFAFRFQCYC